MMTIVLGGWEETDRVRDQKESRLPSSSLKATDFCEGKGFVMLVS